MDYWETRFEKRLQAKVCETPGWNRTLPRKKILERLPQGLNESIILEVGCGASRTLCDVYGKSIPNYVGLDLSFYACRLAQKRLPRGLFVQASAESLPFKDSSIDVMIAYGSLHHLPGHERSVASLLPVIKTKGYLVGSDPLLKPRILRPRWMRHLERALQMKDPTINPNIGNSPHNEWIDWNNLVSLIRDKAEVIEIYHEYGPLRAILVQLFYDDLGIKGKSFTRFMMLLDQLWLATAGKLHRAIGPAGIQYALQKC